MYRDDAINLHNLNWCQLGVNCRDESKLDRCKHENFISSFVKLENVTSLCKFGNRWNSALIFQRSILVLQHHSITSVTSSSLCESSEIIAVNELLSSHFQWFEFFHSDSHSWLSAIPTAKCREWNTPIITVIHTGSSGRKLSEIKVLLKLYFSQQVTITKFPTLARDGHIAWLNFAIRGFVFISLFCILSCWTFSIWEQSTFENATLNQIYDARVQSNWKPHTVGVKAIA